ncbi:MAG: hypothetical protein NZT92_06960 [Abditibacteriales bacterium]|nr:hypothetical protein [Abditibacteriales bacterium]MDW8364740.1 hypothetical protein [Abditibacteriales bacterium]
MKAAFFVGKERIKIRTHGGAHRAMECSGNPAAEKLAIAGACVAGKVLSVGENRALEISPSEDLIRRDITLMGSWYLHRADYFENLELMRRTGLDPFSRRSPMSFPSDDLARGFEVFCGHKEECLKVVVRCHSVL